MTPIPDSFCVVSGLPNSFSDWSIEWAINAGFSGSLRYGHDVTIRQTINFPVGLTVNDGRNSGNFQVSQLYLRKRSKRTVVDGPVSTTFELVDATSTKLASGGESFDTFKDTTYAAISSAIAGRFGVTITGAPSTAVWKEDVKQSAGWAVLQRLAAAEGLELQVNLDGSVSFVPMAPDGTTSWQPVEINEDYSPHDQFGSLYVQKRSGQGIFSGPQYYDFQESGYKTGALASPLNSPFPTDQSAQGSVGWVGFWDGPPNGSGKLISLFAMNGESADAITVPFDGQSPATHYSCNVYPSKTNNTLPVEARLRVTGSSPNPIPAGIEPAFSKLLVGTNPATRGFTGTYNEPLLPTEAFTEARKNLYLAALNRGTDIQTARGVLDHTLRLRQGWGWDGFDGRIVALRMNGGPAQVPVAEITVETNP